MSERDVVIIGAGPAGLGCAVELQRAGIAAIVLERADQVAASWRSHYDRLRLNTSRWFSRLPDARYPSGAGLFPSRDDLIRCLEDYAVGHRLDIRFQTHVFRIDGRGNDWILQTSAGEIRSGNVVVATGLAHTPVIPKWPGREEFRGTFIHSSEYRNPEPFTRQSVLVIGAGSSGMEIAQDLAEADVRSVRVAVRTPPNIILRSLAGLPGDPIALLLLRFPPRLADGIMAAVRRATLGDLSTYGLPLPDEGPFQRMRRDGAAPAVVDREVIDSIRSGRIELVPGVESFESGAVVLRDGRRLVVDAVIAATGYRCDLEPLVGHLGVLDEQGRPRCPTGEEAALGLRFIAFRPVPGLIGDVGHQVRRIAKEIRSIRASGRAELRSCRAPF